MISDRRRVRFSIGWKYRSPSPFDNISFSFEREANSFKGNTTRVGWNSFGNTGQVKTDYTLERTRLREVNGERLADRPAGLVFHS